MLKRINIIIVLFLLSADFFVLNATAGDKCSKGLFQTMTGTYKSLYTIEITAPDRYVYALIDGSIVPHQFSEIRAKLRNTRPEKGEMLQGTLVAYASYRKRTDYQPDLSKEPPSVDAIENSFSHSISAPIAITSTNPISSTEPTEFVFDFTNGPAIPAGIIDLYLHVVYVGTLDMEEGVAAAEGMKDLNEPMHITVGNYTDRFYLDGTLRSASEIRSVSNLRARVDLDNDGEINEYLEGEPYIDPHDVDRKVAFYSTGGNFTDYQISYTSLAPGRFGRVIILIDEPSFMMRTYTDDLFLGELTAVAKITGVKNQIENGIFYQHAAIPFRGIYQHWPSAFALHFPDSAGICMAAWPELENKAAFPIDQ
ncbi:MAG: hypothetical protein ACFFCW_23920 [Candidatus Hodarchaeota archaeon]